MKRYKIGVIILAILIMTALTAWIGTVTLKPDWYRRSPIREQLEEGKAIVRKLEEFKVNHGRWPSETEAASILPGKLMTDQRDQTFDPYKWEYSPGGPSLLLRRYTGLGGECLWYSYIPFDDKIPRWYLRDEGGPVKLLPADP
jgi:hypothetical protein